MADVVAERKVVYAGLWRQNNSSDYDTLLRQISAELEKKGGLVSVFQICLDGVKIIVLNKDGTVRKTEMIPGQNIQDITVNRYNPICLMTVFVDGNRRLNFLVCSCHSKADATHLVQTYRENKKVLSGEGYKIDLKEPRGLNWTLKSKSKHDQLLNGDSASSSASSDKADVVDTNGNAYRVITSNGFHGNDEDLFLNHNHRTEFVVVPEVLERERCEIDGCECFSVAVQTEFEYQDKQSLTSTTSFRSLKDELLTLSQEVREIKFILEKSTGVSTTEYFKREKDVANHRHSQYVPLPLDYDDDVQVPSSKSSSNGDRHVNFDHVTSVISPEHDIRSFGVQTENGKRERFMKRQVQPITVPTRNYQVRSRSRSSSASSIPVSPSSVSSAGSHQMYARHDAKTPRFYKSTIARPIEHVYHAYTQEFRQPRRKMIVMPGSSKKVPASKQNGTDQMKTVHLDKNGQKK